jgi:hypothetical protein
VLVHQVTQRNASILKLGEIKFCIDNGKLLIHAPGEEYPFPLSACDTLALFNLLADYKLDIITVAHVEQRERERKRNLYSKKPKKLNDTEAEEIQQQLMRVFQSGGTEIEPPGDSDV